MLYGTWKTGRDRMSSDRGGALAKLHCALVFLDIAVIAALSGFTGIAGTAAWIAKLLFVLFLVLVVIAFSAGPAEQCDRGFSQPRGKPLE
jgi:uncharacterized membrane protein YtjA (UPF0391 family)